MDIYLFIPGLLGVWRITHLLHAEDGPGEVVVKLRRLGGHTVFGQAMDCFYCLSLWVAAPFALLIGQSWQERALLWPALSGAAIVMELLVARLRPTLPVAALYAEDGAQTRLEENDVQLREITTEHDDDGHDADWDVARSEPRPPVVHAHISASAGIESDV